MKKSELEVFEKQLALVGERTRTVMLIEQTHDGQCAVTHCGIDADVPTMLFMANRAAGLLFDKMNTKAKAE